MEQVLAFEDILHWSVPQSLIPGLIEIMPFHRKALHLNELEIKLFFNNHLKEFMRVFNTYLCFGTQNDEAILKHQKRYKPIKIQPITPTAKGLPKEAFYVICNYGHFQKPLPRIETSRDFEVNDSKHSGINFPNTSPNLSLRAPAMFLRFGLSSKN